MGSMTSRMATACVGIAGQMALHFVMKVYLLPCQVGVSSREYIPQVIQDETRILFYFPLDCIMVSIQIVNSYEES